MNEKVNLKIGYKIEHIFNGLNHHKLKLYANVGADPNPIHYNDSVAKREGLKKMNSQYLYPTGFIIKLFEKFFRLFTSFQIIELGIHPQELKYSNNHLFYNSYWRCNDTLYSIAKLSKIDGVRHYFDINQYIISPVKDISKYDNTIKSFKPKKKESEVKEENMKNLKLLKLNGREELFYLQKQLLDGYIIVKIKN